MKKSLIVLILTSLFVNQSFANQEYMKALENSGFTRRDAMRIKDGNYTPAEIPGINLVRRSLNMPLLGGSSTQQSAPSNRSQQASQQQQQAPARVQVTQQPQQQNTAVARQYSQDELDAGAAIELVRASGITPAPANAIPGGAQAYANRRLGNNQDTHMLGRLSKSKKKASRKARKKFAY